MIKKTIMKFKKKLRNLIAYFMIRILVYPMKEPGKWNVGLGNAYFVKENPLYVLFFSFFKK